MNSYKPLFQISLLHDYYEGSSCPDLSIRPTPACEKLLKGHRMPAKASMAGIQVKTAVDARQRPFLPLSEGTKLSFFLDLQNPCFKNFTALDEPSAGNMHLFSNTISKESSNTTDKDEETLSHDEISRAQAGADHTPFALVEIQVTKDTPIQGKKFVVHFNALEFSWQYYLIAPNSDNNYTIDDTATNGTEEIEFIKEGIDSALADTDKVASALLDKFPKQKMLRFTSTNKVAAHAIGRKNIQLKRGNNTLIQHLPNPPTSDQGIKIIKL